MIIFLDTNNAQWTEAPSELGSEYSIGQLLTPLTRYADRGGIYAIDNGAFAGFNPTHFRSLLERQKSSKDRCKFVAVPDVVGSARRTEEVFRHWYRQLCGWPLALVAQDGIEDIEIPWELIDAIFIGGSTEFKLGSIAEQCIKAAKAIGKWVHVGRVNTPDRVAKFSDLGVDSIDGSGISRFGWMRRDIGAGIWQPLLSKDGAGEGASVGSGEQGDDASMEVKR